jgi:3-dehydroquinate synthase
MILNYGHTFGHAIETMTNYKVYTHGEAVAIGMNMVAHIAQGMGICEGTTVKAQQALIELAGLPIWPEDLDLDKLFDVLKVDKKVKRGKLTLVLPENIGTVRIETDIDEGEIRSVLQDVMP